MLSLMLCQIYNYYSTIVLQSIILYLNKKKVYIIFIMKYINICKVKVSSFNKKIFWIEFYIS